MSGHCLDCGNVICLCKDLLQEQINNSKLFHCPNFTTTDSGYVACDLDKHKLLLELEALRKERDDFKDRLKYEVEMIDSAARDEINSINLGKKNLEEYINTLKRHYVEFQDEIDKLKKQNDLLRECVEFYGKDTNWRCPRGAIDFVAIKESDRYFYKGQILCGGKAANECLDKLLKENQ